MPLAQLRQQYLPSCPFHEAKQGQLWRAQGDHNPKVKTTVLNKEALMVEAQAPKSKPNMNNNSRANTRPLESPCMPMLAGHR